MKVLVRPRQIRVGVSLIAATLVGPRTRKACPAVLFIHGWKGSAPRYVRQAETLAAQGIVCLVVSLRGHGQSQGDITEVSRQDHLEDVTAAYDFLISQGYVNKSRIGVFGGSYGAYLAMLLSSNTPVSFLVLRVPALYRDAGFNRPTVKAIKALRGYRQRVVLPQRNRALAALSGFRGDVLVVSSELDGDVPQRTVMNVLAACQNAHAVDSHVVRGADHNLSRPEWGVEATAIFNAWILARSGIGTPQAA